MPEGQEMLTIPQGFDAEESSAKDTEKTSFASDKLHGEIVSYPTTPERIRKDRGTGEPVRPLIYVQGMHGDEKLPWTLKTFAEVEQRQIIALKYDSLIGSSKIVPTAAVNPEENALPEIDNIQANELIAMIESLGIGCVDLVAESRGAIRAVAALAKRPDLFRTVLLAHPAGQDNRGYLEAHFDAARQFFHHAARKALGKIPDDREPEDKIHEKHALSIRRFVDTRKEQKSVARSQLSHVLGEIAEKYPDKNIFIAGDEHNDKAFLPQRLQANKGSHVKFISTNWGRHSIGYNRNAIQDISKYLQEAEIGTK